MKKLTLLLVILLSSCSTDSPNEDCECIKTSYRYEQGTTTGSNGLPRLTFRKIILAEEVVSCQIEQDQTSNGNETYFDIVCN